jgi:hypothetical protein
MPEDQDIEEGDASVPFELLDLHLELEDKDLTPDDLKEFRP